MSRRRAYLLGAAVAGALAALGLAVRFGPALAFACALAFPSADAWLGGLGAEPRREETTLRIHGRPLLADLYRPAVPRAALLLVHGLSPAGRRHPELVRLARLLARHDRLVLVPQFEGLAAFRLGGREVEEIVAALRHLTASGRPAGIAGFSFGAGPALLAAASVPDVPLVASFGGYADLRHVVTYITTGVHTLGGRRYVHRQEEYNRWKLLALLAGFVEDAEDHARLQALAARKLANPADATGPQATALGAEGRTVLALALNRDEAAVAPLLARLPPRAREAIDRLSPVAVVPRLAGRLLIAHGADDDSIPFTESLRLAEAAGGRARVAILQSFHHTGPRAPWAALGTHASDAWRLLRLVDALLAR